MGIEGFVKSLENLENNMERYRANQAASFERTFQNTSFNEGTRPRHIPTINEKCAGEKVNGIRYARRVFMLDGEKVEGVFPIFESKCTISLPQSLYKASDNEQMRYCTERLANRIKNNPDLASKFTPRQLEQIKNGEPRISGLTWHHNEIPGRMQLVNAEDHSAARHTGGRSLWGGGGESR